MRWEGRKICEIDVFMMTTRRGQVITATWKVFPFKRCQKVGKWHYNSQRRRTGGAGSGSGKKRESRTIGVATSNFFGITTRSISCCCYITCLAFLFESYIMKPRLIAMEGFINVNITF